MGRAAASVKTEKKRRSIKGVRHKKDKKYRKIKKKKSSAGKTFTAPRRRTGPGHRRRHGRMILYYLFFGAVGVILTTVLCYTVFFKVYKITVSGDTGRYTSDEIISASGIAMKDSLFKIDERSVFVNLSKELPYIETVQIRKHFPTRVDLSVTVAKPVGAIKIREGNYLYIDGQGKILENNVTSYDSQYPLVLGISPASTDVGSVILSQTADQLMRFGDLIREIKDAELENISYISVADRLNMRIIVQDRVLVELGTNKDLDYKLLMVKQCIDKLEPVKKGVLDLTLSSTINRSYFREERDLLGYIEQEEQKSLQNAAEIIEENKIKVDPETGQILIGPTIAGSLPVDSLPGEAQGDNAQSPPPDTPDPSSSLSQTEGEGNGSSPEGDASSGSSSEQSSLLPEAGSSSQDSSSSDSASSQSESASQSEPSPSAAAGSGGGSSSNTSAPSSEGESSQNNSSSEKETPSSSSSTVEPGKIAI